jgi:TRAP-type transport system periplasmic protein
MEEGLMKRKGIVPVLFTTIIIIVMATLLLPGCSSQTAPPPKTQVPTSQASASKAPAAQTSSAAPSGQKILKWAYNMPKTGAIVVGWEWFAAEFEKRTNGKYKIDFYPAASLMKETEQLEGIVNGVTQISNCGINSYQQQFAISTVVSLPSTHFPDTKEGHAAAYSAAKELLEKFPAMKDEFKNYKLLSWNTLPANIIISKNKKIVAPADLKGLKSASQGNDKEMIIKAGGVAVSMPPPEVYQSLDKGVVDAATVSWIHLTSNHFEEIAQYYLDYSFGNDCQTSIMGWDTWNSMSPDVQQIVTELIPQMEARSDDNYMVKMKEGRKLAEDKKWTITTPNADQLKQWSSLADTVDTMWLEKVKAKGVADGPAILNLLKQRSADAWSKNK